MQAFDRTTGSSQFPRWSFVKTEAGWIASRFSQPCRPPNTCQHLLIINVLDKAGSSFRWKHLTCVLQRASLHAHFTLRVSVYILCAWVRSKSNAAVVRKANYRKACRAGRGFVPGDASFSTGLLERRSGAWKLESVPSRCQNQCMGEWRMLNVFSRFPVLALVLVGFFFFSGFDLFLFIFVGFL